MDYLHFSLGFFLIHVAAYVAAGALNFAFTKHLYGGADGLFTVFMRDMSDRHQQKRVNRWQVPIQFVRAALMSVVLYPVLDALGDLASGPRFLFFFGLMYVYTDLASATPFTNLEGLVYLKRRFVTPRVIGLIQSEMVVYSLLFGGFASWLLF